MYIHSEIRRPYNRALDAASGIVSSAITGGFKRDQCLLAVKEKFNTAASLANDTSFFYQDSVGNIFSNISNPIIQETTCVELCGGSGMGWYPDTATRLLTWFVPVLFLMASIKLAPIGAKKFVMVSHLFGDPIHSYWSLLSKLKGWDECYEAALKLHGHESRPGSKFWQFIVPFCATQIDKEVRDTAVILAAIMELLPADTRATDINYCTCFSHIEPKIHKEIAYSIVGARTSGTLSTWFAISTYVFGIVCAFISRLGGQTGPSGPSGGRIAPAMLLSWLLPIILLSNQVGQLRREDCIKMVVRLEEGMKKLERRHSQDCNWDRSSPYWTWNRNSVDSDWNGYLDSQAWSGGIYSCQLQKKMFDGRKGSWFCVAVAVLSVSISFSIAFRVLYSYPTFFSCRNIMFVGMMAVWLFSPFMTRGIMTSALFGPHPESDFKFRWRLLVIKDNFIGISILTLLIASSCGLGNSCRCWAGFFNGGGVVLAPDAQFTKNNTYIYPTLIGVCLFLQYLVFKTGLYIGRTGLKIMTWNEKDRRASLPQRATGLELENRADAASRPHGETMLKDGSRLTENWDWEWDQ